MGPRARKKREHPFHSQKVVGNLARRSESYLKLPAAGQETHCPQQCSDALLDSQPFPTNPGGEWAGSWCFISFQNALLMIFWLGHLPHSPLIVSYGTGPNHLYWQFLTFHHIYHISAILQFFLIHHLLHYTLNIYFHKACHNYPHEFSNSIFPHRLDIHFFLSFTLQGRWGKRRYTAYCLIWPFQIPFSKPRCPGELVPKDLHTESLLLVRIWGVLMKIPGTTYPFEQNTHG